LSPHLRGDAPRARNRGAGFQPDQSDPSAECVGRTGHGLDAKAAPPDVGKRVTREGHQAGVTLVDPQRDPYSLVRISKLDACHPIRVPIEIGECMVERRRANRLRLSEIIIRTRYSFRSDWKPAFVGSQHGASGCAQIQAIDGGRPEG
jgi:hypothetical protein